MGGVEGVCGWGGGGCPHLKNSCGKKHYFYRLQKVNRSMGWDMELYICVCV